MMIDNTNNTTAHTKTDHDDNNPKNTTTTTTITNNNFDNPTMICDSNNCNNNNASIDDELSSSKDNNNNNNNDNSVVVTCTTNDSNTPDCNPSFNSSQQQQRNNNEILLPVVDQQQQQHEEEQNKLLLQQATERLYNGIGIGPMVRASSIPLRTLALQYGADYVYTEELIDRSISTTIRTYNQQLNTIDYIKDPDRLSKKQKRKIADEEAPACLLRIDPTIESGKLICQLGTGKPELAVQAALHVSRDVDSININMGCPKKFSVGDGMGSALLKDTVRASAIIREVAKVMIPKGIPVSAKIRLLSGPGVDDSITATINFVSSLIQAGASAIIIHGRRVGDPETIDADWFSLKRVIIALKAKFPTTPILANGDFYTRDEFVQFMRDTDANGILLARPALYNTSIFRKPLSPPPAIHNDDNEHTTKNTMKYDYNSPLLLDKTVVIQDYIKHCLRYDMHYKNMKYVICEMMNSRRAPIQRVPYLPQIFPGQQTIGTTCTCTTVQQLCTLWNVSYIDEIKKRPTTFIIRQKQHQNQNLLQQPNDEENTSDTKTTTTTTLADDHTYSDEYILQRFTSNSDNICNTNNDESLTTTAATTINGSNKPLPSSSYLQSDQQQHEQQRKYEPEPLEPNNKKHKTDLDESNNDYYSDNQDQSTTTKRLRRSNNIEEEIVS